MAVGFANLTPEEFNVIVADFAFMIEQKLNKKLFPKTELILISDEIHKRIYNNILLYSEEITYFHYVLMCVFEEFDCEEDENQDKDEEINDEANLVMFLLSEYCNLDPFIELQYFNNYNFNKFRLV